ncbi:fungal-specific transcription factor domain-containing protein [Ilyonectria robusta]|uniref:fungal-specific transcription factor domain-containing protein n=1 Tax=Ilyonectria robusta TaxID=1079257 RepID=UPI001E8E7DD0|nr:fungal-specific transcription factor domain-containing protein [Ilyonectria robusta]KAH8683616.1 fungal-specific transcription factor domain-containing protein [Ilyonectria robusta]
MSRIPEGGLACNSCRRRKLRCSREAPSCQHCRKTGSDCVYEAKRGKPGMKTGAIENLHRRLGKHFDILLYTLERSVARQQTSLDCLQAEAEAPRQQAQDPSTRSILSLLATELQKFNATPSSPAQSTPRREQNGASAKRRRLNDDRACEQRILVNDISHSADERELEEALKSYFNHVHPWIPIIHEGRFRRRLDDDEERGKLHLVLKSMILVASRYIEDEEISNSLLRSAEDSENYRDWVVSKAMKHLSVENLQALLIIAFNDASQAWPLVGSLTRMAEYLQLTVEHDEAERPSFSQPYKSLSPAKDWTEAEERRRVFWNVFSLDRFCSVSMGWNTSLTSDDVNRRLPCDGITWRKETPVTTPYFGIWDKSAGRIGNPIGFFPTHPVPLQATGEDEGQTPSEAGTSPDVVGTHVDMSTIGAFAYCIEATESLSRVTSYFLQQKVNIRDQKDLSDWLTRFKELDLRLVHWKMLLPQKWKVNTAQDSPSRMDPNLTLAHVIHNASMILLHQPIAFPPPDWPFKTRLPSLCSIDTCQAAAIEIATITDRYLNHAPSKSILSSQFSFCVYIAARVLLLHWRNGSVVGLTAEFWLLVESLKAMSRRWAGTHDAQCLQNNLAAKYASFLIELHSRCAQDESFSINVPGYTTEVKHSNTNSQSPIGNPNNSRTSTQQVMFAPQSIATTMTPSSYPVQITAPMQSNNIPNLIQPDSYHRGSVSTGDLTAISQMLLDQQFADMDRIISYDDGMFVAEYEGGGW